MASQINLRYGSVFEGLILNHQSGNSTLYPSKSIYAEGFSSDMKWSLTASIAPCLSSTRKLISPELRYFSIREMSDDRDIPLDFIFATTLSISIEASRPLSE